MIRRASILFFIIATHPLLYSENHYIKYINKIRGPKIEYIKTIAAQSISAPQFPLANNFDPLKLLTINYPEKFIAKIPNATVFGSGVVEYKNQILKDFFKSSHEDYINSVLNKSNQQRSVKIVSGSVAVIESIKSYCYYNWVFDIFSRLLVLQNNDISYDWLYVSSHKPFMKELLLLAGVDAHKIITPSDDTVIQADEIIAPSLPRSAIEDGILYPCKVWHDKRTIDKLNQLILPLTFKIPDCFSKKVFISRSDTSNRQITNEDEIFALFEHYGFQRYSLSDLSIIEQAALFNRANIIVATHGAGLTNLIFCKPNTTVIEMFQTLQGSHYFYLSKQLQLHYEYIKTIDSEKNYTTSESLPLTIIQNFIQNCPYFN